MSVEVGVADIAKIILQFCRENGLPRTLATFQEEAHVYLNIVDSADALAENVETGQWDAVIRTLTGSKLPEKLVIDLFEQVVLELVELRELDTARALLRTVSSFQVLQRQNPTRYLTLERQISVAAVDPGGNTYGATSKQARRNSLAKALRAEVADVAPARLLAIIGQALKYQHAQGLLPPGTKFDLFRNLTSGDKSEADQPCVLKHSVVRFGSKSHASCAMFSPRDDFLVTGSSDGFVEVWDYLSGKLRTDLRYQAEDDLMTHDASITCMAFSREAELLATGALDNKLKVWRIRSGKVLRRFELSKAPTCVKFSRDGSQLLAGSPEGIIRLLGMKSGKVLKEFHGHTAAINDVHFVGDGSSIISAGGDGTVRIWSTKTCQTIKIIRPPNVKEGASVLRLQAVPDEEDRYLVCTRSQKLQVLAVGSNTVSVTSKMESKRDVADGVLSTNGMYAYALGEDGIMRCFEVAKGGEPVKEIKAVAGGPIGLAHHPSKNVLAVYGSDSVLLVFRP
mmetsp:Transcript_4534/g.13742  ORF Transcript_4534/g.13742 Transcript_4534/m.13742 type:complete len:510 (+) Transcript_4534:78-1607(+)